MNIGASTRSEAALKDKSIGRLAAGGIIISHTLQHLYGQGFFVILPVIYTSLGLTPVAAGLIGTVRQVCSGIASTIGGFAIDKLHNRRGLVAVD